MSGNEKKLSFNGDGEKFVERRTVDNCKRGSMNIFEAYENISHIQYLFCPLQTSFILKNGLTSRVS